MPLVETDELSYADGRTDDRRHARSSIRIRPSWTIVR